jgi:hypothetical protein
LPRCLITYQRQRNSFGYFSQGRFGTREGVEIAHEIALNPKHFRERTEEEILATLAHEMCHLWQHEFGKKKSSQGLPQQGMGGADEDDRSLSLKHRRARREGNRPTGASLCDRRRPLSDLYRSCSNTDRPSILSISSTRKAAALRGQNTSARAAG